MNGKMDHYNLETHFPNDFIDLNEADLNHPQFESRNSTVNREHGSDARVLQTPFPKVYSYTCKRQRTKRQPLDNRRTPKETASFRKRRPYYDWDMPLETDIRPTRYDDAGGMHPPPFGYDLRDKLNPPYSLSCKNKRKTDRHHSNKHAFRGSYPGFPRNQPDFYGSHFYGPDQNSNFPAMQNYMHPELPRAVWGNVNSFQASNIQYFSQDAPFNGPQICSPTQKAIDCDNTICSSGAKVQFPPFETDLSKYFSSDAMGTTTSNMQTDDISDSPSTMVKFSPTINGALLNPPNEMILEENTAGQEISMNLPDSLSSSDETALSVHYLQNLYPRTAAENSIIDLNPYSQIVTLNKIGENLFQEVSEDKDSDQIMNGIYSGSQIMNQLNESVIVQGPKLKESSETNSEEIKIIQSSSKEIESKISSSSPVKTDGNSESADSKASNSFYVLKIKNGDDLIFKNKSFPDLDGCIEAEMKNGNFIAPEAVHIEQEISSNSLPGTASFENSDVDSFVEEQGCDESAPVSFETKRSSPIFICDSKISQSSVSSYNDLQASIRSTVSNLEENELDLIGITFPEKTNINGADTKSSISHASIEMHEQNQISSSGGLVSQEICTETTKDILKSELCPYLESNATKSPCIVKDKDLLEKNISGSSDLNSIEHIFLSTEEYCSDILTEIDDYVASYSATRNLKSDREKPNDELNSAIPPNHVEASVIQREDLMKESTECKLLWDELGSLTNFISSPACQVNSDIESNGFELQHVNRNAKCEVKEKPKVSNFESNSTRIRITDQEELLNPTGNCLNLLTTNIDELTDIKYLDDLFESKSLEFSEESANKNQARQSRKKVVQRRKKSLKSVNYSIESPSMLDSSGSTFMYSDILDSNISLNQIETSLSSITNYVLDDPLNFKLDDEKPEAGSIKGSQVTGPNSGKRRPYRKNEWRRTRVPKQKKVEECHLQSTFSDPFLSSASVSNLRFKLLEDGFELSSLGHPFDDDATKNRGQGKKRKKVDRKHSEVTNIKKCDEPISNSNSTHFRPNESRPRDDGDFIKMDILRRVLKEFCASKVEKNDAFTQTPGTVPIDKCDAQTQWDLPYVSWSGISVKREPPDEEDPTTILPSYTEKRQLRENVAAQRKNVGCRQEIYWNLRARRTIPCSQDRLLDLDCLGTGGITEKNNELSKPGKNLIVKIEPIEYENIARKKEASNKRKKSNMKVKTEKNFLEREISPNRKVETDERKKLSQTPFCQNQQQHRRVKLEASISDEKSPDVGNTKLPESRSEIYYLRKRKV